MQSVEGLRQKIGGKSIPDEKFAGKKAMNYAKGISKMPFAFMEAAYWFNYLKVGNGDRRHAEFWLEFLEVSSIALFSRNHFHQKNEAGLDPKSEDSAVARLLKANLFSQLGRYVEACAEAQITIKMFPKPKQEPHVAACALFELGNAYRLQGMISSTKTDLA